MTSEDHFEDDPSYRYWKAAISCLSTQEKREIAEEFLRTRLEGGRGADTLFALILLLEANGAFLQTIPQHFDDELIRPLGDLLNSFRSEFQTQTERQLQTSRAIGLAHDEIDHAARDIRQVSADFERKLQAAVLGIDVREVAVRLSYTLERSALKPMETVLRNLEDSRSKMEQATDSAQKSVETWRKIHFGGILVNYLTIAGLAALILTSAVYWGCNHYYGHRLAAEIVRLSRNDEAYGRLLALGADIRVGPWVNADGKPVEDGYTLSVSNAEDAQIKESNGQKEALIFIKRPSLQKIIEETQEDIQELQQSTYPLTHGN